METIHQAVQVRFHYPVSFTSGLFGPENLLLADVVRAGGGELPKKVLCVVDRGVAACHPGLPDAIGAYCRHHATVLTLVAPPLVVEGGEGVKNDPANVAAVQEAVERFGIDRQAYIVAVGGGATIDMVGFAAATAHRGVRLIRVPTTTLAQNDSAVGVKNSVNAFGKKNFLGTFAPPVAVLNDGDFLATLSDRDWRGGIAEAIKVALLKDPAFFAAIERHAAALAGRDPAAMHEVIYRCAQLHLAHIAGGGDPFEFGSSRPLDFGHWAAHKLEQLSGYALRHGEAVAIGIALDSTYAHLAGLLPESDWQRILDLLSELGFAVYTPELGLYPPDRVGGRRVLAGLDEFREHLGGQLTVMLLRAIGEGLEVHEIDEALMIDAIELLEDHEATQLANPHGGYAWTAMPALAR